YHARMTSRTICALLCSAAFLTGTPRVLCAQTTSPNTKLISARALYYTPTVQGLKSFRCTVDFDWKDFLTRYSGTDVKDDNSLLQYLHSIHLAVADDLNGDGKLEWATSAATPKGKEDSVAKMKDGMQQMMIGFFTSWNAYMNGNMVPVPDSTTTVTDNADGFRLHAASGRAQHPCLLYARARLPHSGHAQLRAQERGLLRVQVLSLLGAEDRQGTG